MEVAREAEVEAEASAAEAAKAAEASAAEVSAATAVGRTRACCNVYTSALREYKTYLRKMSLCA